MAADWIKIEHGLPRKPEVMELSRMLEIDEMTVVGHLVCFWSWVDQNLSPLCPSTSGTKKGLDRVAGCEGFVDAMVTVGWLEFDGHTVTVPNYEHHLSQSAKKRAFEARKKTRQRSVSPVVSPKCPPCTGTKSGQKGGPENRREEESLVSKETREIATAPPSRSFSPPTIPEVIEFVLEKSLCIDAADFVHFYESKNWMVGKSKMKDWRAAALGWDSRNRKEATNGRQNQRKQTAAEAREQLNASGFEWIRQAAAEAEAAASGYSGSEIPAGTGTTLLIEKHSTTDATCF